jgi:hypothetical protein
LAGFGCTGSDPDAWTIILSVLKSGGGAVRQESPVAHDYSLDRFRKENSLETSE